MLMVLIKKGEHERWKRKSLTKRASIVHNHAQTIIMGCVSDVGFNYFAIYYFIPLLFSKGVLWAVILATKFFRTIFDKVKFLSEIFNIIIRLYGRFTF